jgi:pimeloyl-ACP methyl ester carboxylesterase
VPDRSWGSWPRSRGRACAGQPPRRSGLPGLPAGRPGKAPCQRRLTSRSQTSERVTGSPSSGTPPRSPPRFRGPSRHGPTAHTAAEPWGCRGPRPARSAPARAGGHSPRPRGSGRCRCRPRSDPSTSRWWSTCTPGRCRRTSGSLAGSQSRYTSPTGRSSSQATSSTPPPRCWRARRSVNQWRSPRTVTSTARSRRRDFASSYPTCAATTCHHGRTASRPMTPAHWPPTSAASSKNAVPSPRCWGAESALLVGHDWGGTVAWATAMNHPEVVDRLAILNAAHPRKLSQGLHHPGQLRKSRYFILLRPPRAARRRRARQPLAFLPELSGRRPPGVHAGGDRSLRRGVVAARGGNRDDQPLPGLGATVAQARRSGASPDQRAHPGHLGAT